MSKQSILVMVAIGVCVLAAAFAYGASDKNEEGYLGIFLQPVPQILAVHIGIAEGIGVVAADVAAESPASKAGMVQYDVVVSLNGKDVKGQQEFSSAIRAAGACNKVKLGLISKGQKKELEVLLGALSDAMGRSGVGGRRLLRDGERPDIFLSPGKPGLTLPDVGRGPRFQPLPDGPDIKPFMTPEVDQERLQILEDRIQQIEKQQAEILEKLDKLLAK
jgi:hypothetical protein